MIHPLDHGYGSLMGLENVQPRALGEVAAEIVAGPQQVHGPVRVGDQVPQRIGK